MNLFSTKFPILLDLCMRHLLSGNLAHCAAIATQVLSLSPDQIIFQLILSACNRTLDADAASIAPQGSAVSPPVENESQEALEETRRRLEEALVNASMDWTLYERLGGVFEKLGQHRDAAYVHLLSAAHESQSIVAHEGLLRCYVRLQSAAEVVQAVELCRRVGLADGEWQARLAAALMSVDQLERAKELCLIALTRLGEPSRVPLYMALGELERRSENYNVSEEYFRKALKVSPLDYSIQRELLNLLITTGKMISAKATVEELCSLNPRSLSLFFLKVSLELQPGYHSEEHVDRARAAVVQGLEIIKSTLPTIPERIVPEFETLFDNLNFLFYLPYQGRSVVAIQRTVAEICYAAMQRLIPLPPPEPRAPLDGRKIRLGVASAFFRDHSNYKIPIRGWMRELDRSSFETFAYHFSPRVDAKTEEAKGYFDYFEQQQRPLRAWVESIRADKLDVLIFPEIGMDPMTRNVACFRLAPVQVNSWGHPVTSGLPTIDYFLSSDLMEGPQAEEEYTEQLVRLPLLSVNYDPPKRERLSLSRSSIGLRQDSIAYWCCQVIYKQLPRFDWVYPEIAARVPNSQFVFITIQPNSETAAVFKQRLKSAFTAKGLNPEHHLTFLSGLNGDEFATCASLCDLSLDSFEWSGCNSSLETLAQGVPVITCPGAFMRGKHTEAILRVIGCEELITATPNSYIDLAVLLSADLAKRQALSQKVKENIRLAHNDTSCVRELERRIKTWVRDKIPE